MENLGFVKIYRKILDNPLICKDCETFSIWMYLLLNATHTETPAMFKGERIILKSGQLITGTISISKKLKINKDKVQRTLKCFETDKQIAQQTSNKNRLITILNWDKYQKNNKQFDKQLINNCETTDKQLITNKNDKNINNDKNILFNLFINKKENENQNQFVPFSEGDEVSLFLKTKGVNSVEEFNQLNSKEQDDLIDEWFCKGE